MEKKPTTLRKYPNSIECAGRSLEASSCRHAKSRQDTQHAFRSVTKLIIRHLHESCDGKRTRVVKVDGL
jgi:hypothetical protein